MNPGRLAMVISPGPIDRTVAESIATVWEGPLEETNAGAATFFGTGEGVRLPGAAGPDGKWVGHRVRLHASLPALDRATNDPVHAAWTRRGEACFDELLGDWCLVSWDPAARRLTVARDQCGVTDVFWWAGCSGLAVATDLATLRAMPFVPGEPDDLAVARGIFGQCDPEGTATLLKHVHRLPPGHVLTWTAGQISVRRYWDPADVAPVRLTKPEDYVHAFRDLATQAVTDRLGETGLVACHLSGGLDSGTIAALAGPMLQAEGRPLIAITAAPLAPPAGCFRDGALIDEWPLAAATAAAVPGCRHVRAAQEQSVVGAVRSWLNAGGEPVLNPPALRWLAALAEAAREHGARTMLTGTFGNAAFSWGEHGAVGRLAPPLPSLARRVIPNQVNAAIDRARRPDWFRHTALHPQLASGDIGANLLTTGRRRNRSRNGQLHFVRHSLISVGILGTQSRIHDLDTVDPTFDRRLLEFCLGVPTHVFRDPPPGLDRKLIRQATAGLLPDQVRLNRRPGIQSADLVPSLRDTADEVEAALAEVGSGRAAEYVDVAHMRDVWQRARTGDHPGATQQCSAILMRGMAYGLWLNALCPSLTRSTQHHGPREHTVIAW